MFLRFLSLTLLMGLGVFTAQAQNIGSSYTTAIGIKGYAGAGGVGGLNIKHFFNGNNAVEGSILFRQNFFAFEGIYEWHGSINGAPGLRWYAGPGAWLGATGNGKDNDLYMAAKGTLGLDYKISGAPVNVALDVNPHLRLTQNSDFDFYAGFAFRFTL